MIKYEDLEKKLNKLSKMKASVKFENKLGFFIIGNNIIEYYDGDVNFFDSLNLMYYDDLIIKEVASKYNLKSAWIKDFKLNRENISFNGIKKRGMFFKESLKNVDQIEQVFSLMNEAQKEIKSKVKYSLIRKKNSSDYNYFVNLINYMAESIGKPLIKNSIEANFAYLQEELFCARGDFITNYSKFSSNEQKKLFLKFELIDSLDSNYVKMKFLE